MPFRDIVGHRHLVRLLARSVATSTLPPSLIFSGPDGVGKKCTAVALAQALNCGRPVVSGQRTVGRDERSGAERKGREASGPVASNGAVMTGEPPAAESNAELAIDACGDCPACRRIARGAYPDVLIVGPGESGSIKIEQVRDVVAQTAYRPFEGRRRVIIVDEADAMGTDAQDALLKSLEEPPPLSVFVLVSARPDTLLPTVRSRCSRLRFGRLSAGEIARALAAEHGYTEQDARTAAARAGGSLARALEAADGVESARAAACAALRRIAEAADARERLATVKDLVGVGGAGGASDRDAAADRLTVLLALIRDLAVLSTRAHDDALASLDLTSELEGLTRLYDRDRIVRAFTAADRALSALGRNASPKIVADWLALHL